MKIYIVIHNLFLILGVLFISQIGRSASKSLLSTNPFLGIAPQGYPLFSVLFLFRWRFLLVFWLVMVGMWCFWNTQMRTTTRLHQRYSNAKMDQRNWTEHRSMTTSAIALMPPMSLVFPLFDLFFCSTSYLFYFPSSGYFCCFLIFCFGYLLYNGLWFV